MTGLIKPQKYSWQDSNLSLFGSDIEKNIKKHSADFEPCWRGITEIDESKLIVWRIEKFKVVQWSQKDYGTFYNGDSYIILNVTKSDLKLCYDIHFWIGKYSSQDEYGTAAYKTVELDNLLSGSAIQHREVQGYESDKFKSYFRIFSVIKGGTSSGFRHVSAKKSEAKLLAITEADHKFTAKEIKMRLADLGSDKAYVLESYDEIILWIGKDAEKMLWIKMIPYIRHLEEEKNGRVRSRIIHGDSEDSDDPFYRHFTDDSVSKRTPKESEIWNQKIFRLSDATGQLLFLEMKMGNISRDMISEMDVYLVDCGTQIFVFVGSLASKDEKKNALTYAHEYLKGSPNPLSSVTCLNSNQYCQDFENLFTKN